MKPSEEKLLTLLSNHDVTFFIPPFQRNYEWTYETSVEGETLELKETTGQRVGACETLCAVESQKGWM